MAKIVIVTLYWESIGGIEGVVRDTARSYTRMGWEVDVVSVFDIRRTWVEDGVCVRALSPRFHVARVLWHRLLWVRSVAQLLQATYPPGTPLVFAHVILLQVIARLHSLYRAASMCWTYGIEVWGEAGRPYVTALNDCGGVLTISRFTAGELYLIGVRERVTVIPCAVDTAFFTPGVKQPELASDVMICGRMSQAEQYKGHDILLESIAQLQVRRQSSIRLRVVGGGDDLPRLREKAKRLGLGDSVTFAGRVSSDELVRSYRSCRCFCMPSRVDRMVGRLATGEGFGIVYIEAAACGRPVIASNEGGAAETVHPGKSGILVNPRSTSEITAAIATMLDSPSQAEVMGKAGRTFVCENFGLDRFDDRLKTATTMIINRSGSMLR